MRSIGIDIGGTKIAGGIVLSDGTLEHKLRVPTPKDPQELVSAVIRMGQELLEHAPGAPVGVAVAGFLNKSRSLVLHSPNLDWPNAPLRDELSKGLGVEVTLENDANAAGWGEYRYGAGRGVLDMVLLTIGTGVGGAIITDGVLLRGGFGAGAELGHIKVVPEGGILCGCGQRGCLEQYGSGRALQRYLAEIAAFDPEGTAVAEVISEDGIVSAKDMARLVHEKDPGALKALDRLGTVLGTACASFQAVLDPAVFVLGGGVAELGEALLEPVRRAYVAALPGSGSGPKAEILMAQLGNDAGIIGAGAVAV